MGTVKLARSHLPWCLPHPTSTMRCWRGSAYLKTREESERKALDSYMSGPFDGLCAWTLKRALDLWVFRIDFEAKLEELQANIDELTKIAGQIEEVVDGTSDSDHEDFQGLMQMQELQQGYAAVQEGLRRVEASNRLVELYMQRLACNDDLEARVILSSKMGSQKDNIKGARATSDKYSKVLDDAVDPTSAPPPTPATGATRGRSPTRRRLGKSSSSSATFSTSGSSPTRTTSSSPPVARRSGRGHARPRPRCMLRGANRPSLRRRETSAAATCHQSSSLLEMFDAASQVGESRGCADGLEYIFREHKIANSATEMMVRIAKVRDTLNCNRAPLEALRPFPLRSALGL